jgi:hypothetical protein
MRQPASKRRSIFALFLISLIWIYYIIAISTGAWGLSDNIIVFILSAVVTVALIIGLIIGLAGRTDPYPKLIKILYDSCSPEDFVAETRTQLDKEKGKKYSFKRSKLLICLGTGNYAAGKYQEALDELLKAVGQSSIRVSRAVAAGFFHLLFLIYVELDKLDMAREALGKMIAAAHKLKGKTGRLFKQRFVDGIYLLRVATGVYENADTVFMNSFKTARNNYERVTAAFMLGRVYEHFGQEAEMKDAFEYVVEHGEKLYIVKLAAKRLGSIETA